MEQQNLEPSVLAGTIKQRRVLFFRLMLDAKIFLQNLKMKVFKTKSSGKGVYGTPLTVQDPFKKVMRQALSFGGSLLIVMSFATHGPETGFTAEYSGEDGDFIDQSFDEEARAPFLMNDEGFVIKSSPVTEDVSRIGFNDYVQHTVVSGDTLEAIAALYGISHRTLMWENNITQDSILKIGQTLVVPPVDGVSYTVVNPNATLGDVAKKFNVDIALIKQHNGLADDTVSKGQKLFIPGGKKPVEEIKKAQQAVEAARTGTRSGGRATNTFNTKVVMATSDAPSNGKKLIFPTDGKITQGFHSGHYANDIGNSSQPDIWAAEGGIVTIAKGGCPERDIRVERGCNGGYGNYVIVDHGNGLETLYGHMETLYVTEGQSVSRGQAVGKMGNSGRTYGPTGIHLHFEVRDGGAKRNPTNYF